MTPFHHWLLMGGYASYVWSAYSIGAIVIGLPIVNAVYKNRQVQRNLRRFYSLSSSS